MKNLNEEADTKDRDAATSNIIPDTDTTSTNSNQNENITSIPTELWSSILNNAIHEIEKFSADSGRRIEAIDISVALIILKARHRLSNKCLSDILKLLRILGVPNVPTSLWKCKKLMRKQSTGHLCTKKRSICPSCEHMSDEVNCCNQCNIDYDTIVPTPRIPVFYHFDIGLQLESILLHTSDLVFQDLSLPSSKIMHDIVDGSFYRNHFKQETDSFITLTMNIDGVQPNKGSDVSIWPVLMVVNEIRRSKRYSLENVILAGVWPGPKKPSRDYMAIFLRSIVDELKCLEAGRMFQLRTADGENMKEIFVKVFLITSCCDKPAQCLVQCLPEPTARFGCGRCEIKGDVVETEGGGHVTSFAIDANQQLIRRSNERYDELLETMKLNNEELESLTIRRDIQNATLRHKQSEKGLKRPCILRELKHFDVGQSFVVDSLHNIYLGVFKRLLKLWLKPLYKSELWSICTHLSSLAVALKRVKFPSTTTRHPRSLLDYKKFKANELRVVLLCGYPIFEKFMHKKYYDHFKQLVLAVHLAESRALTEKDVEAAHNLSHNFLLQFPNLYGKRHNVQVIHSLMHLSESIRDFGPLTNYTTFNFESLLGLLTRSTKSTSRHALEMMNNLLYLRDAHLHLRDPEICASLGKFLLSLINNCHTADQSSPLIKVQHLLNISDPRITELFSGAVQFYSSVFIGRIRLTTSNYSRKKNPDDSSIVYRAGDEVHYGRIDRIFTVDGGDVLFQIFSLASSTHFTCETADEEYDYNEIEMGMISAGTTTCIIKAKQIIEKCVFYLQPNSYATFVRFPNLVESS
ncbi:unnamed protein product [Rotaria magnacalcarata]|uniref:Uncharacterized protein n=1 Tax=Rotaria magnacalcarata TaxID=392030 RepID=A0A816S8M1_9BILA|nr:unnamed protein product [Rotaria magnacalcarata]CAF4157223.1 unnamed protein product [Rotaria magnacalcarata]